MKTLHQESSSDFQTALQLAHDIASPLTVMQMNMNFLKKNIPENNLSMMQAAINQIREITFAVLNTKKSKSVLDLNLIIHQIVLEKKYEWKESPCNVELLNNTNEKFFIYANKSCMFRMLSNLLNNAHESLHENRDIFIYLEEKYNSIVLNIKDSGCGIPENKIDDVLNGKSFKSNGHGVGLSSAYNYMKQIGGDLEIESIVGSGTQVKLHFPK